MCRHVNLTLLNVNLSHSPTPKSRTPPHFMFSPLKNKIINLQRIHNNFGHLILTQSPTLYPTYPYPTICTPSPIPQLMLYSFFSTTVLHSHTDYSQTHSSIYIGITHKYTHKLLHWYTHTTYRREEEKEQWINSSINIKNADTQSKAHTKKCTEREEEIRERKLVKKWEREWKSTWTVKK